MADKKMRHEYKHYINYSDYLELRSRLQAVAKKDSHVDESGTYRIRSLYFDNIQDKALREKLQGISVREKFRIRYYNDDFDFIKLEKKYKINGLCGKDATLITREQCEAIINGDIDWMPETKHPLFLDLYTKMKYQLLKPKVIVDYLREPYVYKPGNVRVTIDSEIKSSIYSLDFFNQGLPMTPVTENPMILEVKYDEFLPAIIQDAVQLKNRRASAYSKYAACRMFG